MERTGKQALKRRVLLLAILLILGLTVQAAQTRASMVLEVSGGATAMIEGRNKPLRTLQTLPSGTKVEVPSGGVLRMAYLESGRKEKITGPYSVVIGSQASETGAQGGKGRLEVEASRGATTLVPRSNNLRRMGGTIHAQTQLEALDLVAMIPIESNAREVRIDPKPRIQDLPPGFSHLPPGREVYWIGGDPPYKVLLSRDDGEVIVEQQQASSALTLPALAPGHEYTLQVTDGKDARADAKTFYLLSKSEARTLNEELKMIAKANQSSRIEELVLSIAYLEERGLLGEALPLAEEAAKLQPNDPGLLTTLGRLQLQLGRFSEADQTLNQAIELDTEGTK